MQLKAELAYVELQGKIDELRYQASAVRHAQRFPLVDNDRKICWPGVIHETVTRTVFIEVPKLEPLKFSNKQPRVPDSSSASKSPTVISASTNPTVLVASSGPSELADSQKKVYNYLITLPYFSRK